MTDAAAKGERIAKRIAAAGLCSRRDAERWIADGRVVVDGKVLTSPALNVFERTAITVDGAALPQPVHAANRLRFEHGVQRRFQQLGRRGGGRLARAWALRGDRDDARKCGSPASD